MLKERQGIFGGKEVLGPIKAFALPKLSVRQFLGFEDGLTRFGAHNSLK